MPRQPPPSASPLPDAAGPPSAAGAPPAGATAEPRPAGDATTAASALRAASPVARGTAAAIRAAAAWPTRVHRRPARPPTRWRRRGGRPRAPPPPSGARHADRVGPVTAAPPVAPAWSAFFSTAYSGRPSSACEPAASAGGSGPRGGRGACRRTSPPPAIAAGVTVPTTNGEIAHTLVRTPGSPPRRTAAGAASIIPHSFAWRDRPPNQREAAGVAAVLSASARAQQPLSSTFPPPTEPRVSSTQD